MTRSMEPGTNTDEIAIALEIFFHHHGSDGIIVEVCNEDVVAEIASQATGVVCQAIGDRCAVGSQIDS